MGKSIHYLDTNCYRKIVREGVPCPNGKKVALSYVTWIELMEQLQRAKPASFPEIKAAILLARKHSKDGGFLAYPTDFIRRELLNERVPPRLILDARKSMDLVLKMRTPSDVRAPLRAGKRYLMINELTKGRQEMEQKWADGLVGLRTELAAIATAAAPSAGGPITGKEAKVVSSYYENPSVPAGWFDKFPDFMLEKLEVTNPTPEIRRIVSERLDAAKVFMGQTINAMLIAGYKVEHKANDSADYAQLQYLSAMDTVFVTDDRPLRQRIVNSAQGNRVISLNEFLSG